MLVHASDGDVNGRNSTSSTVCTMYRLLYITRIYGTNSIYHSMRGTYIVKALVQSHFQKSFGLTLFFLRPIWPLFERA